MSKWIKTQDGKLVNIDVCGYVEIYEQDIEMGAPDYSVKTSNGITMFRGKSFADCVAYMEALAAHIGAVNPIGVQL